MTRKMASKDPVTRGSLAAMRRAAFDTGTPFYVWQDGRAVNLNPRGRLKKPRR